MPEDHNENPQPFELTILPGAILYQAVDDIREFDWQVLKRRVDRAKLEGTRGTAVFAEAFELPEAEAAYVWNVASSGTAADNVSFMRYTVYAIAPSHDHLGLVNGTEAVDRSTLGADHGRLCKDRDGRYYVLIGPPKTLELRRTRRVWYEPAKPVKADIRNYWVG